MNLSGVKACFYWAKFSSEYLTTVRLGNLSDLGKLSGLKKDPRIRLCHSQPRSLLDPRERDFFLEEFVSVVRCVAEGYGKVGYLRRDKDTPIHRDLNDAGDEDTSSEPDDENTHTPSEMISDNGYSDSDDPGDSDPDDDPFKLD